MTDLSCSYTNTTYEVIRNLDPLEHLFWLTDQNQPFHFAMTAQVSGETRVDDWRQALARLQERHPLLSASIEGEPGATPWFRRVVAPIPLRIVHGDPHACWAEEVAQELAVPFDSKRAPLVRAVLIHTSNNAAFILVAHHSIADGMSLAFAVRDTLRAISGSVLEPLPPTFTQEDMLPAPPAASARIIADAGRAETQRGIYRPRDYARPQISSLRLTPALTAGLRDCARREATTVHGALCAALVFAGRKSLSGWRDIPLRILSPIDIRQLLGVGDNCGMFVSAASSVCKRGFGDFWELARQFKADVRAGQMLANIEALFADLRHVVAQGLDVAAAAEFVATAFQHDAVLTNLRRLPFGGQFGHLELEALWGPCVLQGFQGEQTIGAVTIGGSLCLTHTSHTPGEGLLERMCSVLRDVCPDHPQ